MKFRVATCAVVVAVILLSPGSAVAAQKRVDCAVAQSIVEKEICAQPTLLKLDSEIAKATASLKAKLQGENAEILRDTEKPFLTLRNDCENFDSQRAFYREEVRACIQSTLKQRLELLRNAESSPRAIRQAINQVKFIDIPFFWKYREKLIRKKVVIFGCIELAPASKSGEPRIHGKIKAMRKERNVRPIPILFKSMNSEDEHFLDMKTPCSWWKITVQRREEAFVLYSEEVLGNPLS